MAFATACTVVLITLIASMVATLSNANGKLLLYANDDFDDVDAAITVSIGPAQRCYSLKCEPFKASFAAWTNMQVQSKIAFYTDSLCWGKYVVGRGSDGFISFEGTDFDKRTSSVMIWESGVFETRGYVSPCAGERTAVGDTSMLFGDAFNFSDTGEYGDTNTWSSLEDDSMPLNE